PRTGGPVAGGPAQLPAAVGDDAALGQDRTEQGACPGGVVAAVVDPAGAQLGVLRLGHERVLEPGDRFTAVGQRHLVEDGGGASVVLEQPGLDTDLTGRV